MRYKTKKKLQAGGSCWIVSPLSIETMSTTIPRDSHFLNLKFSRKSDSLVHIERFNDMTMVQGFDTSTII